MKKYNIYPNNWTKVAMLIILSTFLKQAKGQEYGACYVLHTVNVTECDQDEKPYTYAHTDEGWYSREIDSVILVSDGVTFCTEKNFSITMKTSGTEHQSGSTCKTGIKPCETIEKPEIDAWFFKFPKISPNSTDKTMCVGNINSKSYGFTSDLSSTLFSLGHIKNFYLQVSNSTNFSTINQVLLSQTNSSTSLSYKDLAGAYTDSWYGKGLYYRLMLVMKNDNAIYGPKSYYGVFFRALDTPSLISIDRSACKAEKVTLKVAPEIANNIDNYRFRAIENSENTSNPIKFKSISVNSQYEVLLKVDSSAKSLLDSSAAKYTFHAFDVNLDNIADLSSHKCVKKWDEYIPIPRPALPQQGLAPEVVATVGDTTYHITRYDTADGKCDVTIANLDKCDTPLRVKYKKGTGAWKTIAYTSLAYKNANTRTMGGLSDGTYSMEVIDQDGCPSGAGTIALNKPKAVTIGTLILNDSVTCHPDNGSTDPIYKKDGEVGLQWTGGIPPYTIDYGGPGPLNTSGTTAIIGSLPTGALSVTITDKYGVATKGNTTVYSNEKLGLAFSNDPVKCFGDLTNLSVMLENAQKPNTYRLYGLDGDRLDSLKNTASDTAKFGYLAARKYTAEVESGGCIASSLVEITGPEDIVLKDSATKIAEYGGSTGKILLDISGGTGAFSYSVYDGDNARVDTGSTAQYATIENLVDGLYDIYVKDANLCGKGRSNVRVRQPGTALALTYSKLDVDCYGNATGEIYPKASGGWGHYQYGLNGAIISPDTIIPGLAASTGTDTVFVTDSANVAYKLPVTVTQPDELLPSAGEVYNLKCFEDSTGAIKLDIKGGTMPYEVSLDGAGWIPGDSIGKLPATEKRTYYVRDGHNCQTETQATITQPDPLSITNDTIIDAFCNQANGGIHTIIGGGTVADGYQYEWSYVDSSQVLSNPSPSLDNIYSGQYSLQITDDNLCQMDTLFLVSDKDGPKINEWAVDSVSCYGNSDGEVHITGVSGGMPGYTFYIDGAETPADITSLPEGRYHVRALDSKNCKVDMYVQVGQPEALQVYETITPPTCHDWLDGSVIAVARGGNGIYSYKWGTGGSQAVLDSVNSGTFSVVVTDQKGCSIEQKFEVVSPEMPKPGWVKKDALICTGNYVTVDGGDFVSWSWKNGKGEEISTERAIDLRKTGQFILELVDNLGCIGLDTFNLEVSDTPLDSKLLLPDSAHVEETINVIDVTWPVPDSIQWFFDQTVVLLDSNSWSQHFMSEQEGLINVTLRAWYDGCYSDSSKTVYIFYEEGFEEEIFKSATNNLIAGYRVFPNPNSGVFSVEVALSREAGISISVYGPSMAYPLEKKTFYGLDHYLVPCSLNGPGSGVYILVIQAENESRSVKIVVN